MSDSPVFEKIQCSTCGQDRYIVNGIYLKEFRIKSCKTLREVGKELKLSASFLCDIEHGRRTPPHRLIDYWMRTKTVYK